MTGAGHDARALDAPVRTIAYYLPQFHRIPENDAWWGEGFTEWTNVRRARPLFPGHAQPKAPGELGWYDLAKPGAAEAQAALAAAHGVDAFCYYFYWFDGKRLLERPLEAMLSSGKPAFPFCVCWANENWTRRWDGRDHEVLVAQRYGRDDADRLYDAFEPLFRDARYVRVGGRPLLLVYKPALVPAIGPMLERWRARAAEAGLPGLYLVGCETGDGEDPLAHGFDASVEFPPHRHRAVMLNAQVAGLDPAFRGIVTSYHAQVMQSLARYVDDAKRLRCVFPSWDNTPRQAERGTVFAGSTPELFGYWVEAMVRDTRRRLAGDERLLFVNAWNEWAEGCILEPDTRYGTQYLEALRDAVGSGARAPLTSRDRPRFDDVVRATQSAIADGELRVERFGPTPADHAPGVSVVMPVYRHERFLERTLASIAAQTLAPLELVAVDDGSPDGSAALIERFARTAPFPVTLARQPNRGAPEAINRGLALARGATVALLNSDDAFAPQRLERLVEALDRGHDLAFSGVAMIDDDDRPASGRAVDETLACIADAEALPTLVETLVGFNVAASSGNAVFRRSLLDRIGGFASNEICHDWNFMFAAARRARVVRVPDALYRYRVHDANTLSTLALAAIVDGALTQASFVAELGRDPSVDRATKARVCEWLVAHGYNGELPA